MDVANDPTPKPLAYGRDETRERRRRVRIAAVFAVSMSLLAAREPIGSWLKSGREAVALSWAARVARGTGEDHLRAAGGARRAATEADMRAAWDELTRRSQFPGEYRPMAASPAAATTDVLLIAPRGSPDDGTDCLVCVASDGRQLRVEWWKDEPGKLQPLPASVPRVRPRAQRQRSALLIQPEGLASSVRFTAARPDPHDPLALTIEYQVNDGPTERIVARVGPNGVVDFLAPGWHDPDTEGHWWPGLGPMALGTGPGPTRTLAGEPGYRAIAYLPDGRLAVAGLTGVRVLDPAAGPAAAQPVTTALLPPGMFGEPQRFEPTFVFSPGGTRLAVHPADPARPAVVVDVLTGRRLLSVTDDRGGLPPAFADEDRLVVAAGESRTAVWDVPSGTRADLPVPPGRGFAAAANRVAVVTIAGTTNVTVFSTASEPQTRLPASPFFDGMSLSPDGRLLVTSGYDGMRVYDVATGLEVWSHVGRPGNGPRASPLRWSADGRLAATSGNLGYAYVWTATVPGVAYRFPYAAGPGRISRSPRPVAISADGGQLAALDDSGTVSIWDLSGVPALGAGPTTGPAR